MELIIIVRRWNDLGEKYRAECKRIIKERDREREREREKKGTLVKGVSFVKGVIVKSWNEAWSQNPMQRVHFLYS